MITYDSFKKQFILFLLKNNIINEYIYNCRLYNCQFAHNVTKILNPLYGTTNFIRVVKRAFPWNATPQGYDFWDKLDQQWTQFFNSISNDTIK